MILPSFSLCIPTGCPTCLPTSGGGDLATISQVMLDRFHQFFIAFYRSYRDAYFEPLTAQNHLLVISSLSPSLSTTSWLAPDAFHHHSARFYAQSKALIHTFLLTSHAHCRVRSFSRHFHFSSIFLIIHLPTYNVRSIYSGRGEEKEVKEVKARKEKKKRRNSQRDSRWPPTHWFRLCYDNRQNSST